MTRQEYYKVHIYYHLGWKLNYVNSKIQNFNVIGKISHTLIQIPSFNGNYLQGNLLEKICFHFQYESSRLVN
jgi:hypothetical protein